MTGSLNPVGPSGYSRSANRMIHDPLGDQLGGVRSGRGPSLIGLEAPSGGRQLHRLDAARKSNAQPDDGCRTVNRWGKQAEARLRMPDHPLDHCDRDIGPVPVVAQHQMLAVPGQGRPKVLHRPLSLPHIVGISDVGGEDINTWALRVVNVRSFATAGRKQRSREAEHCGRREPSGESAHGTFPCRGLDPDASTGKHLKIRAAAVVSAFVKTYFRISALFAIRGRPRDRGVASRGAAAGRAPRGGWPTP